jgi:hypothetical protein
MTADVSDIKKLLGTSFRRSTLRCTVTGRNFAAARMESSFCCRHNEGALGTPQRTAVVITERRGECVATTGPVRIAVDNILAQSRQQEAEAAYLRSAGKSALLSGYIRAGADLLGAVGQGLSVHIRHFRRELVRQQRFREAAARRPLMRTGQQKSVTPAVF